jgi:transglycosylase-like protein with SLT domain
MPTGAFLSLVLRLAAGILAIQDPAVPVAPSDALAWATAAAYHASSHGLDPFELIGIARNESDFKPDTVSLDGKDCGMTQTRTTFSRYRCRQLRADTWLAFEEAARELTENQERCLRRAKGDVTRCRLNSYNSGVHYARSGWSGGYWLRVSCFTEAARLAITPVADCRRVGSRGDIERILSASQQAARTHTGPVAGL